MGVLQPTWKTVQGKVNLKIFNNEMRTPIVIGKNEFKYKKDAIEFYKKILNSYDFGDSLNENDFDHIIELVKYNNSFFSEDMEVEIQESTDSNTKEDVYIYDVVIAEVQFKTKCFEIIYSNSENWLISFRLMINQHQENTRTTFTRACRGAVQNDIRSVKQSYFDKFSVKGHVDCQRIRH